MHHALLAGTSSVSADSHMSKIFRPASRQHIIIAIGGGDFAHLNSLSRLLFGLICLIRRLAVQ
jgi:hypothetical protein